MRKLREVAMDCMKKLDAIGVPYTKPRRFLTNSRAKKRQGLCTKMYVNGEYEYEIQVASYLLDEEIPIEHLENTLLHELIHTCPYCMNHGKNFKKYANMINKAYGYNISIYTSKEEQSTREQYMEKKSISCDSQYKFSVICDTCHKEVSRYMKECKTVQRIRIHPERYYCKICGKHNLRLVKK